MASTARTLEGSAPSEPTSILELPLAGDAPFGNRRFIPRIARQFVARPVDGGPVLSGIDISFGGMMCVTSDPIWPGNLLELELLLPDEPGAIPVSGRVVELVSFRGQIAMRIRFEEIPAENRKRIAVWMARG